MHRPMITLTNLKTKETLKYKNKDVRFCFIINKDGKLWRHGLYIETARHDKVMKTIKDLKPLCGKALHLKRKPKFLDIFCVIYQHKTNKRIFYVHKKTNLQIMRYAK